jgi:hypothetical protein
MKKLMTIEQHQLENRIFTIRGIQVMIDRDIAEMYEVETKRLNEQVKRNIQRFPEKYRFQLTMAERDELVANCDRLGNLKHSSSMPYAFTEHGVAMLSAVLKSKTAIQISLLIIDAFISTRRLLLSYEGLLQRMDRIELQQSLQNKKFEEVFKALESKTELPKHGVYFSGQIYDAYTFASDLIRSASKSIQLIDNYVDDTVLTMLDKRQKNVLATIFSGRVSAKLKLDLRKHNEQYAEIQIKEFDQSHDRFIIIDERKVFHLGASLKDLGKKWFAFTEMQEEAVTIISKVKQL